MGQPWPQPINRMTNARTGRGAGPLGGLLRGAVVVLARVIVSNGEFFAKTEVDQRAALMPHQYDIWSHARRVSPLR